MSDGTVELLRTRRSYRAWKDEPVALKDLEAMRSAVLRAPTAGNMALYSVIEITDTSIKEELAHLCDEQPMIAKAPGLWLFVCDCQKWYDYFKASNAINDGLTQGIEYRPFGPGDLLLSFSDALIAAQSGVVAADSLGIGSCYIGDILENYERVRKLLKLPRYVLPATLICFGYPKGGWKTTAPGTIRHGIEHMFFQDTYQARGPEELLDMYASFDEAYRKTGRLNETYTDTAHYYYLKKHSSTFMYEMNRSVAAMLASWIEEVPTH